jgi:hypothetical protein
LRKPCIYYPHMLASSLVWGFGTLDKATLGSADVSKFREPRYLKVENVGDDVRWKLDSIWHPLMHWNSALTGFETTTLGRARFR